LAVDKPRLKGYEHMQKNIKTAPGCNLTFRKNCLDKWVHLNPDSIHPREAVNTLKKTTIISMALTIGTMTAPEEESKWSRTP
jgi:hypothetical protein